MLQLTSKKVHLSKKTVDLINKEITSEEPSRPLLRKLYKKLAHILAEDGHQAEINDCYLLIDGERIYWDEIGEDYTVELFFQGKVQNGRDKDRTA